jgi:hypothetical protein
VPAGFARIVVFSFTHSLLLLKLPEPLGVTLDGPELNW